MLISAYACEPGEGSEPGTGWSWAAEAARRHDVWVLTRENNVTVIAEEAERLGLSSLHVIGYDLPEWMRRWKRGQRGIYLYYSTWQWGASRVARRLCESLGIDVVHHATFANYWLPTFMWRAGTPLVFGPVGGGETMPLAFLGGLSGSARRYELKRALTIWLAERMPAIGKQLRKSDVVLCTSEQMARRARSQGARRVEAFGPPVGVTKEDAAVLSIASGQSTPGEAITFVSIGRMLPWKGFHIGIAAFARAIEALPGARYLLVGDGPERTTLEALAEERGVGTRVEFAGWVDRSEMLSILGEADVLVHPSLHDPGAWVVAEALVAGKVVVCHDGGGPAELAGGAGCIIHAIDTPRSVEEVAELMKRAASDPEWLAERKRAALERGERLRWNVQGARMDEAYYRVVGERS